MSLIKKITRYVFDKDYRWVINAIHGLHNNLSDKEYISKMFFHKMGYNLDLDNPVHLSEKLQWLKLNCHDDIQTDLVDKYKVKKIVGNIIGEQYIIKNLGVWDDVSSIDFEKLPNQFVMKCTHNSGKGLCVCDDKNKLNIRKVKHVLKKALAEDYYLLYREWPYKNVTRRIIAEEYLHNSDGSPLVDYKFYCFGGKPRYFMYSIGEAEHNVKNHKFDMDYHSIDHLFKKKAAIEAKDIILPSNISEMVDIVNKLCSNFKHVRVDLYNIDGKIYFGEMTFYTNGGFISIDSEEYSDKMAGYIEI